VAIIAPGIVANKQWARGRHELRLNQPRFGGAFLWRQRRVQPCWQAFWSARRFGSRNIRLVIRAWLGARRV